MRIEYEKKLYDAVEITSDFEIPAFLASNFGYEAKFIDNVVNITVCDNIVAQGQIGDYLLYDTCKDLDGGVYCALSILPAKELNKSFTIKQV